MASKWPPGFEIFWVHIRSCTSSFQCMIMEHPVGGGRGNSFSGSMKSEPFSEQGFLNQSPMNVRGLFQSLHNMRWKGPGCRTRPENPAVFYYAKYHRGLQTQNNAVLLTNLCLVLSSLGVLHNFREEKKTQTPKQNNKTTAKDTTGSNTGKSLLLVQLAALLAVLIWVCPKHLFSELAGVLARFMSPWHKLSHLKGEKPQLRKCLHKIELWARL